jgi:hypothetical protein
MAASGQAAIAAARRRWQERRGMTALDQLRTELLTP